METHEDSLTLLISQVQRLHLVPVQNHGDAVHAAVSVLGIAPGKVVAGISAAPITGTFTVLPRCVNSGGEIGREGAQRSQRGNEGFEELIRDADVLHLGKVVGHARHGVSTGMEIIRRR